MGFSWFISLSSVTAAAKDTFTFTTGTFSEVTERCLLWQHSISQCHNRQVFPLDCVQNNGPQCTNPSLYDILTLSYSWIMLLLYMVTRVL